MDGYRCQAKAKVAELEVHGSKNQLNKGAGCLYGLGDQEPCRIRLHQRKAGIGESDVSLWSRVKPCLQCDCATRLSNPLIVWVKTKHPVWRR